MSPSNRSPAIGSGIGDGSPQSPPSATEKLKHAEIGDGSPESPPPPMEKRDRAENMEQLSESMPPSGEQGSLQPPGDEDDVEERLKKIVEKHTAYWKKFGIKFPINGTPESREEMGKYDGYLMKKISNFKENQQFHNELLGFAQRTVVYFNDKNNQKLRFDDIVMVASCICCGNNFWLTIKAIDPDDVNRMIILRSSIHRGAEGAEIEDCKLQTLGDLPPLVAERLAALTVAAR